ncbi:MAG: hypothetical protein KAT75_00670 [Dehalococcoidia bacterium]|nr:hypothetical protein [Dehalococcoidia bacterium]
MGKISDRIMGSVDEFAGRFGNRLAEWTGSVINKGTEKIVGRFEPEGVEASRTFLARLRDIPGVPKEIRDDINKMIEPTGLWGLVAAIVLVPLMLFPMVFAIFQPLGRLLNYAEERIFRSGRMDPTTVIRAYWRGHMTEERMRSTLVDHGLDETDIETLINVTKFYPAPADLVHWQAREVFEPEMVQRYGLDAELGAIEREPFLKAGMTEEQIRNYWRAHWEHASWIQVVEMLRRAQLTEEEVRDWFRLVEIPPFWRDKLIAISWNVPTRVDVRRWWDMRTITEERLRVIYTAQGYHDEDLDDYVLWTKVYTAYPDLIARWGKGWITIDDVRNELVGLGMPAERVEEMLQTKIKAEQPERTTKERDITKTDIIKGVKQGVITRTQGVELLVDMGYSEDESVYILEINIPPDEEEVIVRQRELTKTDIIKGLQAEVITEAQALERLQELRYSRADATFLLAIYKALISPPAEPREREASKADIILAVKKGLITPEDAYLMLQDIDFTPEASEFILAVRAETSPFSPVSYSEFKDRTHRYRLAAGMEAKEMPEELKAAADMVVKLTGEVEDLTRSVKEEERLLIGVELAPEAATERLRELQVTRNRALAELERVTSDYNQLLAEWKHQAE